MRSSLILPLLALACTGDPTDDTDVARIVGTTSRAISVGGAHSCVIVSGRIFCWGANDTGQLGDGTTTTRLSPVEVLGAGAGGSESDWDAVSAGHDHTCGLRAGRIWCWGANDGGQLGDATEVSHPQPVQVLGDDGGDAWDDWDAVVAGDRFSCGRRDGRLYCWGLNQLGGLGAGGGDARVGASQIPLAVVDDSNGDPWTDWTTVSVAGSATCGLRQGEAWCWGADAAGQAGHGEAYEFGRFFPVRVASGEDGKAWWSDWLAVHPGGEHTCGLRGGQVWCWGDNTAANLGQGERTVRELVPLQVKTDGGEAGWDDWDAIAIGAFSCGLRDGSAYCWGIRAPGQPELPTAVPGADGGSPFPDWDVLAAPSQHTCGVRANEVWCFGKNDVGQLGDGTIADRDTPVRVPLPE